MENRQGDRLLRGYLSSRLLLLVIGIVTPLGILAVNAAAFVMRNLAQFRIGIAICALISSLVLNGLTAAWLLRLATRREIALYTQHRDWATIIATIIVIGSSVGAAVFTYLGLNDPSHLPNGLAVLTALGALLIPLGITYLSRIFAGTSRPYDYPRADDQSYR
jgi:D-alanyl-lipoteichoic acid acyltransferase DltB (MBOAT superfamily)